MAKLQTAEAWAGKSITLTFDLKNILGDKLRYNL